MLLFYNNNLKENNVWVLVLIFEKEDWVIKAIIYKLFKSYNILLHIQPEKWSDDNI